MESNLIMNTMIIIGVLYCIYLIFYKPETFASSGALLQLVAKGPQDLYMTGDAGKYMNYYYPYGYYPHSIWNNPTRMHYPQYYPSFYPNIWSRTYW